MRSTSEQLANIQATSPAFSVLAGPAAAMIAASAALVAVVSPMTPVVADQAQTVFDARLARIKAATSQPGQPTQSSLENYQTTTRGSSTRSCRRAH